MHLINRRHDLLAYVMVFLVVFSFLFYFFGIIGKEYFCGLHQSLDFPSFNSVEQYLLHDLRYAGISGKEHLLLTSIIDWVQLMV